MRTRAYAPAVVAALALALAACGGGDEDEPPTDAEVKFCLEGKGATVEPPASDFLIPPNAAGLWEAAWPGGRASVLVLRSDGDAIDGAERAVKDSLRVVRAPQENLRRKDPFLVVSIGDRPSDEVMECLA